jgi:hypothetical protein
VGTWRVGFGISEDERDYPIGHGLGVLGGKGPALERCVDA